MAGCADTTSIIANKSIEWLKASPRGGSAPPCEYNATEAERLSEAVMAVDLARFVSGAISWSCGASCGGDGTASFDLDTAAPVGYYSLWYDVLASRLQARLDPM